MADDVSAVSGWTPVGEKIAGSRDVATGELEPDRARSETTKTLRQLLGLATATIAIATDRKSTRLNSSHRNTSRMPSSA